MIDDAVGRGGGTGRVERITLAESLDEGFALGGLLQFGHAPGPGLGAEHPFHQAGAGLFDDALGQVGRDYLHALGQAEVLGDAHGPHQVLAEQHQGQHLGLAGCSLGQGVLVIGQARAGEGHLEAGMVAAIRAAGGLA
ncbi:hypothetical protein D3C80_1688940 [compost metagenome]